MQPVNVSCEHDDTTITIASTKDARSTDWICAYIVAGAAESWMAFFIHSLRQEKAGGGGGVFVGEYGDW